MKYRIDHKPGLITFVRYVMTVPLIYTVVAPVFLLDIVVEIYHRFSFPIYGIDLVRRGDYIRIDRYKLRYLNLWEKINCIYCGYVNGVLAFASAVAGETEKYWCGIMHERRGTFKPRSNQKDFLPYGDKKAFKEYMKQGDEENDQS